MFELPITDTEKQLIRNSDIADLVNHTNGQGKALFAAAFITHFSGLTPHIHLILQDQLRLINQLLKVQKGQQVI